MYASFPETEPLYLLKRESYSMGKQVGFIGLGTMGAPMANNLLKAGHALSVYDLDVEAAAAAVAAGAERVDSAKEAARAADVLICMLPSSPHVLAAAHGDDGFISGLRPDSTLIDMSTIDPDTTRRLSDDVKAAGASMLDAPVSGSSAGAIDGTLTIMVGGDAEVFESQLDLFNVLGSTVIHCGPTGMGETVKLANQLSAAVSMVGVAEGFAFGLSKGVDPKVLFEVMSRSSGNCWALETRCPVPGVLAESPASNDFAAGFTTDLMHKDLGLAMSVAAEDKLPLYMAALARELYSAASRAGFGHKDFSAVARLFEKE